MQEITKEGDKAKKTAWGQKKKTWDKVVGGGGK